SYVITIVVAVLMGGIFYAFYSFYNDLYYAWVIFGTLATLATLFVHIMSNTSLTLISIREKSKNHKMGGLTHCNNDHYDNCTLLHSTGHSHPVPHSSYGFRCLDCYISFNHLYLQGNDDAYRFPINAETGW
ncbi:MAG: hypothetical protein QW292_10495, partial [Candidatus Parvarchaeota archaeon]